MNPPLTAETITDEQVRALRHDPDSDARFDSTVALADYAAPSARAAARARCAERLNVRACACPPDAIHSKHHRHTEPGDERRHMCEEKP